MGIIGFDFGEDCTVAVWKEGRGGIDIVDTNIPSAVHFTEKERIVGPAVYLNPGIPKDSDAQEECNNVTQAEAESLIYGIKLLIGVKFSELDLDFMPFSVREGDDGYALVDVNHLGTRHAFKPAELLAMVFSQLKRKAMSYLQSEEEKEEEEKCCIGVPAYFTVPQRNAVLNAAKIAGLDPWLLHETTATALAYLQYKSKCLVETEQFVAIIDVGLSRMQISFVGYKEGQLRVLSYGSDSSLGGKQLDMLIFEHFAKQLQDKKKFNVKQNKHARIRLLNHCERAKKTICKGENNAQISLKELMGWEEDCLELTREDFGQICDEALLGMRSLLQKALEEAGLKSKEHCDRKINSVVTGSGSDVPAICDILAAFFGEEPVRDSNFAKFSVAKGCVLQCAIRGNTDKKISDKSVRKKMKTALGLKIIDQFPFSITMCREQTLQNCDSHTQLFKKGASWPCTQSVSVTPDASKLSIYATSEKSTTPTKICKCVFKWPSSNGGNTTSEVQLSIDVDGKLSVKPDEFAKLEYDGEMGTEDVFRAKEKESDFCKLKAIKDDVLDYITKTLKKLNSRKYVQFLNAEDKASFTDALKATQDLLPGQNSIDNCLDMFAKLKKIGGPMETRYDEFKKRPGLIKELEKCLEFVDTIDEVKAKLACSEIQRWLDEKQKEQKARPMDADPALLTADIKEKIETLKGCKRSQWNDAVRITYNIQLSDLGTYNEFIDKFRKVLSEHNDPKKINGRDVLEKQRPEAQPSRWMLIRLDLGGVVLMIAVRGDNVYFLGFQNRFKKWYELGYAEQPRSKNIGSVHLIPNSTFLEAGSSYSSMVYGTRFGDPKPDNVLLKEAICQLNMSSHHMKDDAFLLLDHTDEELENHRDDNTYLASVLRACARISLRLCEPTRLIDNHDDMNANWASEQHHLFGKLVDYIWNWKHVSGGMHDWSLDTNFNWSANTFLKKLGITSIELATAVVALILNQDKVSECAEGEQGNTEGGEEKEEDPAGDGDSGVGDGPVGGGECGKGEDYSGGGEFGRGEGFSGGGGDELADAADFGGGTSAVDRTSDQSMKQYYIRPLVELFSIVADSPILGTIALYDECHSQYIYSYKDRKANLQGGMLTLTGPFEAPIPADTGFLLEVDIPRTTAAEKGDAARWEFEWNGREKNKVTNHMMRTIQGRYLDVSYAVLTHAVEANLQLKLHFPRPLKAKRRHLLSCLTVHGSITATIKMFSQGVQLFDREEPDKLKLPIDIIESGTYWTVCLPLDRHVLAVPAGTKVRILGEVQLRIESSIGTSIGSSRHTFNVRHVLAVPAGTEDQIPGEVSIGSSAGAPRFPTVTPPTPGEELWSHGNLNRAEVSLEGMHESTGSGSGRVPTANPAYTSVGVQFR